MGDPCSKYGYDRDGKQFEADLQAAFERSEYLWTEFVEFMKSHNVTPEIFYTMFHRYHDEFLS